MAEYLYLQVSTKLSTTPLRGVFGGSDDDAAADSSSSFCPDSKKAGGGDKVTWEWFNTTTPQGQQLYVADPHVVVKCLDGHHGA